jgi:small neutral amino acid transporter SnatA (MarC family)
VSFGFLVAALLAATNPGRVALAARASRPARREVAAAFVAGAGLIAGCALVADELLDALSISPESFRIATAIVLGAAGVRTLVWPSPGAVPFAAVLVTPELACLSLSLGADEPLGSILAAAAIALLPCALAVRARSEATGVRATQFLAALQIVVAIALAVSGIRDV